MMILVIAGQVYAMEVSKYDIYSLLTDFGGAAGLWIGISFLMMMTEFLELVISFITIILSRNDQNKVKALDQ